MIGYSFIASAATRSLVIASAASMVMASAATHFLVIASAASLVIASAAKQSS